MISDEAMRIDLPERIAVLLHQEQTTYKCEDYLSPSFKFQPQSSSCSSITSNDILNSAASSQTCSSSSSNGVNELWREKICEWSYQVIDHFDLNREIVSLSLSYLDRYLCTRPVNKKIFQLAAMTTLYLAIKLHEPGCLKMTSLIELSRGYFGVEHVAAMEESILSALSWHVHPPTALCVIRHLLLLLPPNTIAPTLQHDIMELSRFLTELSVCDYFFVAHKPSSIALASMIFAMELVEEQGHTNIIRHMFCHAVRSVGLDVNDAAVEECRLRLKDMYYQGGYYEQQRLSHQDESKDRFESGKYSPVCVSGVATTENSYSHPAASAQHVSMYETSACSHYSEDSSHSAHPDDAPGHCHSEDTCQLDRTRRVLSGLEEAASRKSCKTTSQAYPGGLSY